MYREINLVLALIFIIGCSQPQESISSQKRLDMFYESTLPENSLTPFLVMGGQEMVPLLINEIQKKEVLKRRYLISAIGDLKDKRALSILTKIVLDRSEADCIRCDSMKSLEKIDTKFAESFSDKSKSILQILLPECVKY